MARRAPVEQSSSEASTPVVKPPARARPGLRPAAAETPAPAPVAANGMLFSVTRMRGTGWDPTKPIEQQAEWAEHAQFMNALETQGFVIACGPLEGTPYTLLAVRAEDPQQVRGRLAGDPWEASRLIETTSIRLWRLALGSGRF